MRVERGVRPFNAHEALSVWAEFQREMKARGTPQTLNLHPKGAARPTKKAGGGRVRDKRRAGLNEKLLKHLRRQVQRITSCRAMERGRRRRMRGEGRGGEL